MTIEIKGNWKKGFSYDVHTLDSVYMGPNEYGRDRWNTTRSEMGELIYQLKYRSNTSVTERIVNLLGKFKGLDEMEAIIPVPSTNIGRRIQPVSEIAKVLGNRVKVDVFEDILKKNSGGQELKNVEDITERKNLLEEHMTIDSIQGLNLKGKNVLLIDDLYRSGATLKVATDLLYKYANVKDVYVLTMTKTRSRK